MRIGLVFLLLAVSGSAISQTSKYRVSVSGQTVGSATISEKVSVAGNWVTNVNISMKLGDVVLTIRAAEEYRLDGTPVRTTSTFTAPGDVQKSLVIYSKQNATVTSTTNGKETTKVMPLPSGSIKVPSIAWFKKGMPKVGSKVGYWSLDAARFRWLQNFDKYVSKSKITSKGKTVVAHLVASNDIKVWRDDNGQTVQMILDAGGLLVLLERS